jgi:hypothetical protein
MTSVEGVPVIPMHERVMQILSETAPHITANDVETYFAEQERMIADTGIFDPDSVQGISHDDMCEIFAAEEEVLRQYGRIVD